MVSTSVAPNAPRGLNKLAWDKREGKRAAIGSSDGKVYVYELSQGTSPSLSLPLSRKDTDGSIGRQIWSLRVKELGTKCARRVILNPFPSLPSLPLTFVRTPLYPIAILSIRSHHFRDQLHTVLVRSNIIVTPFLRFCPDDISGTLTLFYHTQSRESSDGSPGPSGGDFDEWTGREDDLG